MRALLPLLLACAACAPEPDKGEPQASYATQLDAPSPDYAALIAAEPTPKPVGDASIEPSSPPPPDARAIGQLWVERLRASDALGGMGMSGEGPDGHVLFIDTGMPRAEFDALVANNGWTVPKHIGFHFVDPLLRPALTDAARSRVRHWPQRASRTGMQNMAALYGHVFVRDGCFFVRDLAGKELLAWFLAETGLDVDAEGYLILVNRMTGWTMARLGEKMVWAGPNGDPPPEQTAALRRACGEHPVADVGNPEAEERMFVHAPHLRDPVAPPPPSSPPPGA